MAGLAPHHPAAASPCPDGRGHVPQHSRLQGVRRGLSPDLGRTRHLDGTHQPASLQGLLRTEPARLRRLAVFGSDRRDRGIPVGKPAGAHEEHERMTPFAKRERWFGYGLLALAILLVVGPFAWILI